MKKLVRVLLILSPILIAGLAYYELQRPWQPPTSPDGPYNVAIEELLDHIDAYKAPMKIIFNADVLNKTGDIIFFQAGSRFLKVNCSEVDASAIEAGMRVYVLGVSYLHNLGYFLAEDIHIHVTYSVYLSLPGAILILLILFVGFKFTFDDFSFSRKMLEENKDA